MNVLGSVCKQQAASRVLWQPFFCRPEPQLLPACPSTRAAGAHQVDRPIASRPGDDGKAWGRNLRVSSWR